MSGFKAVWLGDEDPQSQLVRMGDLVFVKGQTVSVPDDHDFAERIKGNPTFAVDDTKAQPVEAEEPEPVDPDAGTEKAALKAQLRGLGVNVPGNPSVETLRHKLVEATK